MSLESQIKQFPNIAVFCRNHKNLLDEAVAISASDPNRPITFRARNDWRSAEIAIKIHGPRRIYFLPIDDPDGCIKYIATLRQIVLRPTDSEATRELLNESVRSTIQRNEGLWLEDGKPTVKTLYIISNCRKLDQAKWLHFTRLKKVDNDERIDENFRYSYAIVHSHSQLP